jgi:isoleucyl-tRNA synthetase
MGIGNEIISRIADAYRKIRNTARFLLGNLFDFDPERDSVPVDEMLSIDRWALARAESVFDRCRKAYEEYEFHVVYHRMLDLCTVDLSSLYLDIQKDTLYIEGAASRPRRSAQTAMYRILQGIVTTIAPVVPFTSEEIYEALPGRREVSVHLADFVKTGSARLPAAELAAWDRIFQLREAVAKVLERARGAQQIGQSLEADIALSGVSRESVLSGLELDLANIFIVSHVDFEDSSAEGADVVSIEGLGNISIRMTRARGMKCGRCWRYDEAVVEEGGLCDRCKAVVENLADVDATVPAGEM